MSSVSFRARSGLMQCRYVNHIKSGTTGPYFFKIWLIVYLRPDDFPRDWLFLELASTTKCNLQREPNAAKSIKITFLRPALCVSAVAWTPCIAIPIGDDTNMHTRPPDCAPRHLDESRDTTQVQKQKWDARPPDASKRREPCAAIWSRGGARQSMAAHCLAAHRRGCLAPVVWHGGAATPHAAPKPYRARAMHV